ncbi:MAG: class I SAM-dependent methyltransferase [bacterium]
MNKNAAQKASFSFGANWRRFLNALSEERLENARRSLTGFFEMDNLRGKTFLDVGCGSGIFSHSAFMLGAEKIVSFDVDPLSVECCRFMREKAGSPGNWEISAGSVLDDDYVSTLGTFDVVYSFGVLHHTGRMWEAIKNSARLVAKGGYYYIAIYNRVDGRFGSAFWLKVKRFYNRHPFVGKYILGNAAVLYYFLSILKGFRNPFAIIRNYKQKRGMDWRTDVTDWLGGYPYEFASVEEIFRFMKTNFPDFRLLNVKTVNGRGNNWYLFRRI